MNGLAYPRSVSYDFAVISGDALRKNRLTYLWVFREPLLIKTCCVKCCGLRVEFSCSILTGGCVLCGQCMRIFQDRVATPSFSEGVAQPFGRRLSGRRLSESGE